MDAIKGHASGILMAYVSTHDDFKEAFFRIYDDPDKTSAMRAFEAWENSLPDKELAKFHSLAKTVHNHFEDIFAYWDSPRLRGRPHPSQWAAQRPGGAAA